MFRDELGRDWNQLTEQYQLERALAQRLKSAPRAERAQLYRSVYEELLSRVPHHPMAPNSPHRAERARSVAEEAQLLSLFARPEHVLLEIGAGDLSLSREMVKRVKAVIAADVTDVYRSADRLPENLRLVFSDGISLDLEAGTIDIAYSNQLLEHFHPEDAGEHVRNVFRVLRAGSPYVCVTPHRFAGPHDISKYFDRVATAFHIKEYTVAEIEPLFRRNGFQDVAILCSFRRRYLKIPATVATMLERVLAPLPYVYRKALFGSGTFQRLFGIRVVALKG